jgi:hypothetical protein
LIYLGTFREMAGVAADPNADLDVVRNASPALHATLALLILLVATVLAVYKPQGVTPYGARKTGGESSGTPRWVRIFAIIALVVALLVAILIIGGGHGPGRH